MCVLQFKVLVQEVANYDRIIECQYQRVKISIHDGQSEPFTSATPVLHDVGFYICVRQNEKVTKKVSQTGGD